MSYRIAGLDPAPFAALHALNDCELEARGMRRVRIGRAHIAPCRISLDDAAIGEDVLLINYEHQPAATPYRQQGPIFIRSAAAPFEAENTMPPALRRRLLSLRGFDAEGMMIEAGVAEGAAAEALIEQFFANADVAYIHAHYAGRGCFAARIDRA
ncbi:MAG: DUF1203 domain-containing protein [Hyphomonadaceae bacterium]